MFLTTQIQHFIKILLTYGLLIHSVGDFGFWQPRVNKLIRYLLPFAFLLLLRLLHCKVSACMYCLSNISF